MLIICYFRLANESEIKAVQTKMREIQKENDEVASKLAKKERECEAKAEEKVRAMHSINNISNIWQWIIQWVYTEITYF